MFNSAILAPGLSCFTIMVFLACVFAGGYIKGEEADEVASVYTRKKTWNPF